jgi:uncharacterized paraquat-inducible protein A
MGKLTSTLPVTVVETKGQEEEASRTHGESSSWQIRHLAAMLMIASMFVPSGLMVALKHIVIVSCPQGGTLNSQRGTRYSHLMLAFRVNGSRVSDRSLVLD